MMAKKNDKHSMAEDYLAQAEWEASHPLDQRGRPSWKYQPKWIYKRVYPRTGKIPAILWIIIIAISVTILGFVVFVSTANRPGVGIVAITVILSISVILYFLARGPKS
jgi:hypothetical protein